MQQKKIIIKPKCKYISSDKNINISVHHQENIVRKEKKQRYEQS